MARRFCKLLFIIVVLLSQDRPVLAQDHGAGVLLTLVSPNGDLGQYLKKSPGYGLFLYDRSEDGRWKYVVTFMHTSTTARMDTVPTYGIQQSGNSTTILPGYTTYGKFNMNYVNGCLSHRIVHYHQLSWYAGVGVLAGISHISYTRSIETVSFDKASTDSFIAGLIAGTSVDYKLNEKFLFSLDGRCNFTYTSDWSSNYTHTTIGLSAAYLF